MNAEPRLVYERCDGELWAGDYGFITADCAMEYLGDEVDRPVAVVVYELVERDRILLTPPGCALCVCGHPEKMHDGPCEDVDFRAPGTWVECECGTFVAAVVEPWDGGQ